MVLEHWRFANPTYGKVNPWAPWADQIHKQRSTEAQAAENPEGFVAARDGITRMTTNDLAAPCSVKGQETALLLCRHRA